MPKIIPTKTTLGLVNALEEKGVEVEVEHWDKHKHVDIYIPSVAIYIEIDGLQHYTNPTQIIADFNRNHFSDVDRFDTIHIPNLVLEHHLVEVADAIKKVVDIRLVK